MIQKADITRTINLVTGVASKAKALATTGNPLAQLPELIQLASDSEAVVVMYLTAAESLLPSNTSPFPSSNILRQLSWVGQNISWLNLLTGQDPFADARHAADALATKYGITY